MEQEKKQGIALMRYGAIVPLVNGLPDGYVSMSNASGKFWNGESVSPTGKRAGTTSGRWRAGIGRI